jgi:hypothetical protein
LVYSKDNKNETEILADEKVKEKKNIVNKSQPLLSDSIKKENNKGLFSIRNDIIGSIKSHNNKQKENDTHVTPSTKTYCYHISSHILNESLHIPNTENTNPNINNFDLN